MQIDFGMSDNIRNLDAIAVGASVFHPALKSTHISTRNKSIIPAKI